MFAIVYQFKFPGVSEAKVAAGFCSESLGDEVEQKKIVKNILREITIDKMNTV